MNGRRLTLASIVLSAVGALLLLLVLGMTGAQHLRGYNADVNRLLDLHRQINELVVASQQHLDGQPTAGSEQRFLERFDTLLPALERLGEDRPEIGVAARRIETLGRPVADAFRDAGIRTNPDDGSPTLSDRGRSDLRALVLAITALEPALDDALRSRQNRFARQTSQVSVGLIVSTLLFGAFCVFSFVQIHRRIAVPTRSLIDTLRQVRAGDSSARASPEGQRDLARVAQTLNEVLDDRQAADSGIERRQQQLRDALEQLSTARDQLLRAQRISRIGSWEVAYPGERLVWSDQALEILGVDRDDLGDTVDEFFEWVHPDDRGRLRQERLEWLERGGKFESEYRIVRPGGEVRWLHARALMTTRPDGRLDQSSGTIQDITDQKRQRNWLLQYRSLLESSDDLCGIVDATGRYLWVNAAYGERYQIRLDEVVGRHAADILGAEYFESTVRPRLEGAAAGKPQRFETERALPSVGVCRLLVRYYPINVPGQSRPNVGFAITDVTAIRETEAAAAGQSRLLDIAGKVTRFGDWSVDLKNNIVTWSDVTAEIHAMPHGYSPRVEEGISFYAPEYRNRIREAFSACVEKGVPYDETLQIIDANGRRRWVRTVGEPVRDDNGNIFKVHGSFQDISRSKEEQLERRRLSNRLATMLEAITDGFAAFDQNWRYVYVNSEAEEIIGKPAETLMGTTVQEQFPGMAGTSIERALERAMNERLPGSAEQFFEPLDAWFDVRAYPWEEGIAVFFRNVSDSHRLIEQLQDQEVELLRSHEELSTALQMRKLLINSLPAQVAMLDGRGNVIDVNDQWRDYGRQGGNPDSSFGIGRNYIDVCDSAAGNNAAEAKHVAEGLRDVLFGGSERFELEYPCHSPERQQWFRLVVNRLNDGADEPLGAVAMHIDVTERKLAQHELERIAFEDRLTGVLTRVGLNRKLHRLSWEPGRFLVVLDVAGLRDVNDMHGYRVGDDLLIAVAERLREIAGPEGLVARVAGDEFAACLRQSPGQALDRALDEVSEALRRPFQLGDNAIDVDFHGGCSVLGDRRRSVEEVFREAELALFETLADDGPARRWVVFSPEIDARARERIEMTRELRHALEADEFELHFQPKVDLSSGRLISAEALIRWNHPERGLQPPGRFIPIAEQSQLIGPIGNWALRSACRHLRIWKDAGLDLVQVSVNVSLVQFLIGNFPQEVRQALSDFDVEPAALSLEITESVFERHSEELLGDMRELHELGVRISLDDFGTGYSSLRYLQLYPFDEIKIDRAFTANILDDRYSADIVTSVVKIAESMGAETVGEGIESPDVGQALLKLGCGIGQGFYYSMPLEAEDFRWLLEQHASLPLGAEYDSG